MENSDEGHQQMKINIYCGI